MSKPKKPALTIELPTDQWDELLQSSTIEQKKRLLEEIPNGSVKIYNPQALTALTHFERKYHATKNKFERDSIDSLICTILDKLSPKLQSSFAEDIERNREDLFGEDNKAKLRITIHALDLKNEAISPQELRNLNENKFIDTELKKLRAKSNVMEVNVNPDTNKNSTRRRSESFHEDNSTPATNVASPAITERKHFNDNSK